MTLRRRLVLLHSAFAAFAVLTAIATIYGVQVYTEQAAERLGAMVSEARLVEDLLLDLRTLDVHLHEAVTGRRPVDPDFDQQVSAAMTRLEDVARFACREDHPSGELCPDLRALRGELAPSLELCLMLVKRGDVDAAEDLFKMRVEGLVDALEQRLHRLRGLLDGQRASDSSRLFARNAQLLWISVLVAAGGVGLVLAGAIVVRRRLVMPIARLKEATEALARGDLTHRVQLDERDELGVLGESLNNMAASLRGSQLKFRSLFENQRDAVIVCDRSGRIRECHDGDTEILSGAAAPALGRHVAALWPNGGEPEHFWTRLVESTFARQETVRVNELPITLAAGVVRYVDVVAYPVDYADEPLAAFVLRDAEERRRLHRELRRTEQMTAAVTVARGIAHDFKNLLHSAVHTLTVLSVESVDVSTRERIRSALVACQQAASLSRRLSRFATTDRGNPERVRLAEMIPLMVDSLDESFRRALTLTLDCDPSVWVMIDRDHLTQILLNLLINAREAMPDGGALGVGVKRAGPADPADKATPSDSALVAVTDTGCGIAPEDRDRIFQPFFTSKERTEHGPRGLGLAVVYALVTNAGGVLQVDSVPGQGSTFRVYLPLAPAEG